MVAYTSLDRAFLRFHNFEFECDRCDSFDRAGLFDDGNSCEKLVL